MHNGDRFFYRVKIEQFVVDMGAVQRQHGLEMSMGATASLAQIIGPDEDIALGMGESEMLVCASHLVELSDFMSKEPE